MLIQLQASVDILAKRGAVGEGGGGEVEEISFDPKKFYMTKIKEFPSKPFTLFLIENVSKLLTKI